MTCVISAYDRLFKERSARSEGAIDYQNFVIDDIRQFLDISLQPEHFLIRGLKLLSQNESNHRAREVFSYRVFRVAPKLMLDAQRWRRTEAVL